MTPATAALRAAERVQCPTCGLWFRLQGIARHAWTCEPDKRGVNREKLLATYGLCPCGSGRRIAPGETTCWACEDKDERARELDLLIATQGCA